MSKNNGVDIIAIINQKFADLKSRVEALERKQSEDVCRESPTVHSFIDKDELIKAITRHRDSVKSGNASIDSVYGIAHDHILNLVDVLPTIKLLK